MKYSGYIEATICVPFLSSFNRDIPILVIPDNDFILSCPIIIGTNVLCRCKMFAKEVPDELSIPEQWQMAMDKDISVDTSNLTPEQTLRFYQFLGKWKGILLLIY
jgi:hypothetical protein